MKDGATSSRIPEGTRTRVALLLSALAIGTTPAATLAALASEARENLKSDPYLFEDVVARAGAVAVQAACEDARKIDSRLPCPTGTDGVLRAMGPTRTQDPAASIEASKARSLFIGQISSQSFAPLLGAYQEVIAERQRTCGARPQIHSIGFQPELAFEPKNDPRPSKAGERALRIPIDGYALDPRCVTIGIVIQGTVPISRLGKAERNPDFWVTEPTEEHPDIANVILLDPYLDRLKTGDTLTISANFSERYPPAGEQRKVAYSKRTFTLFEIGDYRQIYQKDRIGPHSAFPLSDEEIEALYGPLIARNYFAVRISIRNPNATAKLVSSGGIRVTGTARVEPRSTEPAFAVPLTLVPHSLQEIYSILQDEEVNQPRSVLFRTLEFAGALATGISAITSAGIQTTKNLGLLTGLAIPEGKKAWPDRWPGYQKNLVRDAMPDLIKVGPNSRTEQPKVLFFPKKDIDGMVSDPFLYGRIRTSDGPDGDIRTEKPKTYVVAVSFDNLSIRLEDLFEVENPATRDKVVDLVKDLPLLSGKLDLVKPWSIQASGANLFELSSKVWSDAQKELTDATAAVAAHGDATERKALEDEVTKPLKMLIDGTKPGDAKSKFATDLFGKGKAGTGALKAAQMQLDVVLGRLATGGDPAVYKPRIEEVSATYVLTKNVLAYYQGASGAVADSIPLMKKLTAALKALKAKPADAAAKASLAEATTGIKTMIADLAEKRPAEGVTLALR
jgi:hypothetical protein